MKITLSADELARWNHIRSRAGATPINMDEALQRLAASSADSRSELLSLIRDHSAPPPEE